MKQLLEDLFPIYRTLCGPGALQTLQRIQQELPGMAINEYASGTDVCGWTIPKEFIVNSAWALHKESRTRVLDFKNHPYHLWVYSQPYENDISAAELRRHLSIGDGKIPLRQTYYKSDWGFCSDGDVPDGDYDVYIDAEHRGGFLRIGELVLRGETSQEILVNSYTCHPLGANDNCSGMVACVELFKRLKALNGNHRYTYRLCLWPETIGPITWIAKHPEKYPEDNWVSSINEDGLSIHRQEEPVLCALTIAICGDNTALKYDASICGVSDLDRAFSHIGVLDRRYSGFMGATDSRHFNGMGVNIPAVTLTRGGPCNYPEYHSSADTPDIIDWGNMEETVDVAFKALQVIERNKVYHPNYVTTPCLQKHGIFPYQHGTGNGEATRTQQAKAYFELMYLVDGQRDLLSIADSQGMSIFDFDEPVEKFLGAGLIQES